MKEIVQQTLEICLIDVKNLIEEAGKLVEDGTRAIIARGGTYSDLKDADIGVRLIRLRISSSDVLVALKSAQEKYSKVYLILTF